MEPNEDLEDPSEDYLPPLTAMVARMGRGRSVYLDEDADPEDWQRHHEQMDQDIRDSHPRPERRHCFKCQRWVSFGLNPPEGEDPRCPVCNWQKCTCGGCKCNYSGAAP